MPEQQEHEELFHEAGRLERIIDWNIAEAKGMGLRGFTAVLSFGYGVYEAWPRQDKDPVRLLKGIGAIAFSVGFGSTGPYPRRPS